MRVPGWRKSGLCGIVVSIVAALALTACGDDHPTAPTSGLTAPTLVAPLDDAIAGERPVLRVNNAASTSAGERTYDFQVAESQTSLVGSGTAPLVSATGIAEGTSGQTAYVVERDLQPAKRYYWRSRAVQAGAPGPWSGTFRFRTDFAPNSPPVIQALNPSSNRGEVNAEIELNAVVQDQETSPGSLIYEWSATGGAFSGTGAAVRWRAPSGGAPSSYDLTLTLIERYTVTDADGEQEVRENRATATTQVHVNDSPREIAALATTFIDDFIHSDRSPEYCVRNFSDNCPGKLEELGDVQLNRALFINDPSASSFSIRSIGYNTPGNVPTLATFAIVLAPCRFAATEKATGTFGIANGTCQLTNVYENWQWRLCDSHFLAPLDAFSARFIF